MPAVLVAEPTVTKNSPFFPITVAETIASTYCAYPRRDGQAELVLHNTFYRYVRNTELGLL